MKYNLESTLPIDAFKPRGGRSPFNYGMTLEGGGGGFVGKALGSVAKGVTDVVKGVVQPVYNATIRNIPGVDNALVNLDKSVGKAIPGGWGTVASVAASFIPGAQLAMLGMTPTGLATGLGALTGSGVMRKGNQFNLQGAIMGGAMAYGASQLTAGLQEAGRTTSAIEEAAKRASAAPGDSMTNFISDQMLTGPDALTNIPAGSPPAPNSFTYTPSGEMVPSNVSADITGAATPPPAMPTSSGIGNLAEGTMSNVGDAGTGIKNLAGFGEQPGTAATAYKAFEGPITQGGVVSGIVGTAGMADLDAQQKALDEQKAAGAISQAEYDAAKAKIAEQVAAGNAVVSANPLQVGTDLSSIAPGQREYALTRKTDNVNENFYLAAGGMLSNPPDDQTNMPNQSPLQNFEQGGAYGLASGGMLPPRFLSGGGDGMSDSIHASINGNQEARLADGEFVIPADVVSHLGNGSSKAGAKQLYSMMDKVRKARTGRKSQGKQINPRKYMPV